MRLPESVGIIGLGLMGGSLARSLEGRGVRVIGHDRDPRVLHAARSEGVVPAHGGESLEDIADADLVVIATPVDAALETLERIAPSLSPRTTVTDVGSVKRGILDAAVRLGIGDRFVGSHPLAGDHRSGWGAGRLGLYDRTTVFLCPTPLSTPSSVELLTSFWTALDALPQTIDAETHDLRMAWVSHLPQVVSSAVAVALAHAGQEPSDLGSGGRDVTRLAASSPEMWTAICLANRDHLEPALRELQLQLQLFRSSLQASDLDGLSRLFLEARSWFH